MLKYDLRVKIRQRQSIVDVVDVVNVDAESVGDVRALPPRASDAGLNLLRLTHPV